MKPLEFQLEMHPRTAWDYLYSFNVWERFHGDGLRWIHSVRVVYNKELAIYQPKRIKHPDNRFVKYGPEDDGWLEYFYPELVVPEIEAEIRVTPILKMKEVFSGCFVPESCDINWSQMLYFFSSEDRHEHLMRNSANYRHAYKTREMILDRIAKYFATT